MLRNWFKFVTIPTLATLLLVLSSDVRADNRVQLGCPQEMDLPESDSVLNIPVFISNDVPLCEFSIGFVHNSADIEIDSFHSMGTVMPVPSWFRDAVVDTVAHTILVEYIDFVFCGMPLMPQSDGLAFTLVARVHAGTNAQCVDIDSSFVQPMGFFEFSSFAGGFVPHYFDCDTGDIDIGHQDCFPGFLCGDSDTNGIVNISDAVYLIAYIFGGGPPPIPLAAGDTDCNEIVNISDAVYLIAYIFGGGPAPCEGCP